jgi:nucleoid-associated protein YgaU
MNCPICDYKGLADDAEQCPSCNADLSIYRALDAVEASMKRQKKKAMLFLILFIAALIASIGIFVVLCILGPHETDEGLKEGDLAAIEMLKADNDQLKGQLANLEASNDELAAQLEEARKNQLIIHEIQEGEYLFYIARKYLGDGKLYPRIAADNCLDDPDLILAGEKLKILK